MQDGNKLWLSAFLNGLATHKDFVDCSVLENSTKLLDRSKKYFAKQIFVKAYTKDGYSNSEK